MATILKPIPWKETLWTNRQAVVFASSFASVNYVQQFREWMGARNDQQTARKAWSDYIVECYLNKLDISFDRKPLPFIDFNSTDLNHITWK